MRYTRVYADAQGESHFEDVETSGDLGRAVESDLTAVVSETFPVQGVFFRDVATEASPVPHNAPYELFIIGLTGRFSIEVSDGERREFGPGSAILVQDTTGKGHVTKRIGDEPRVTLMAPLAPPAA